MALPKPRASLPSEFRGAPSPRWARPQRRPSDLVGARLLQRDRGSHPPAAERPRHRTDRHRTGSTRPTGHDAPEDGGVQGSSGAPLTTSQISRDLYGGSADVYSAESPMIDSVDLPSCCRAFAMIARSLTPRVVEALSDTRVVVVLGARQVGKSTLVGEIARADLGAEVLTLDDAATRGAAASDPSGFIIDRATPLVIDEVQRVPDLLLAIKARVDRDPRPGQYLLTGSANILTAPRIADALTGRAEYLRLGPFTQSELHGAGETFVADVLDGRWPVVTQTSPGRRAYVELVATGGYPEARERTRLAGLGSSRAIWTPSSSVISARSRASTTRRMCDASCLRSLRHRRP